MKTTIPNFEIGDTVDVHVRILEGDKERIQIFNGVVIARSGQRPARDVRRAADRAGRGRRAEVPAPLAADRRHRRQAFGQGPPRQALLPAAAFGQGRPPQGAVLQHGRPPRPRPPRPSDGPPGPPRRPKAKAKAEAKA